MTTNAIIGKGIQFQVGDGGGPEVWTTVAEVMDVSGPGMSRDAIDVTTHDSPGQWRQFIKGLKDPGEITFDIKYLPTEATHKKAAQGLLAELDDDSTTLRNFKLVFPDSGSTTWSFSGFVKGFEQTAPTEGDLTASVTIQISGDPGLA